jgi:hypothetical protein
VRTPGDQPPAGGADGNSGPGAEQPGGGAQPPEAGRLLAGRYRVTARLGRGGMGMVWRAVDEVLGREVAVKELRTFTDAGTAELEAMRARMQREARAAARVRHPGVIAVHDVAQHEGRPVIVMELVEGRSLDGLLRERGRITPQEAAAIGAKVMDALAAAHRAGVLHRDVKPGNVLLESGTDRVVLTDFGIAAVEDPDDGARTQLTGSGELVGSLDYLAPERARGDAPREACDVWALGATLYAAVEGAVPFRRTSTWSTLQAIVVEPLPEPVRAGPLAPVLAELMEKDPERRADAERAKALLEAVARGTDLPAGPASTMQLGAAGQGQPPAPWPPVAQSPAGPRPAGGQGVFGAAPAASAGSAGPGAAVPPPAEPGLDTDTDRHTVSTRPERAAGRRRAVVAAAVAAVVLAGAGVTYAAMSGGGEGKPRATSGDDGRTADRLPETGKDPDRKPGRDKKPPKKRKRETAAPGTVAGGKDGKGGAAGGGSGDTTGGGGTTGGDNPAPSPKPVCRPLGGGKFNCTVWKQATSYNGRHKPVGRLNAGVNYFYCQKKLPHRETSGRWTNVWWAKTDDDSGHKGVFISDVYIEGGDNNRPVPGLPVC